jgi:hypothetical protein
VLCAVIVFTAGGGAIVPRDAASEWPFEPLVRFDRVVAVQIVSGSMSRSRSSVVFVVFVVLDDAPAGTSFA